MNIALWIIQVLLAIAFLVSGGTKLSRPRLSLAGQMPYVQDFSDAQVKGIGALEILAAIGLVVPPSVRRRAGIKAGDRLEFKVSGGIINIIPKLPSADDELRRLQAPQSPIAAA